jgi:hypothetical protein
MTKLLLAITGCSLFALAALACTPSSSTKGGVGNPAQGNGQGPDEYPFGCQTKDDCVIVETECCDHCNGGKAEAFNKKQADKYKPKDCGATMCTLRACGPAVAECVDNKCTAKLEQLSMP